MPIHDWTKVDAGTFHDFRLGWTVRLCNALNAGRLPKDYCALVEPPTGWPENGVVPHVEDNRELASESRSASALLPRDDERYAERADRIAIHFGLGKPVAVIHIVSPGNKSSREALQSLVENAADLLRHQVKLLVVNLFPPGVHDPKGIHPLIWDEVIRDETVDHSFLPPVDKPLMLVSYDCHQNITAYVEPVAVGGKLHHMPLFLEDQRYIEAPLEDTYQAAWSELPAPIKRLFDGGTGKDP